MPAPTITLAAIAKMGPCEDAMDAAREALPKRRKFTAAQAREAGVDIDDIVWVLSAMARTDKDVQRRLRLWSADIVAARQRARGEISEAAEAAEAAWTAEAAEAAEAAERDWQFDRLIARMSDDEPQDWPLPAAPRNP